MSRSAQALLPMMEVKLRATTSNSLEKPSAAIRRKTIAVVVEEADENYGETATSKTAKKGLRKRSSKMTLNKETLRMIFGQS